MLEAIQKHPLVWKGPLENTLEKLSKFGPAWFFILTPLLIFIYEQAVKSKKKKPEKISLNNLIGLKNAKTTLQLTVKALKGDRQFEDFGEKTPGGVLLCGPENTGKTTLANAIAHDAGVAFFPVSTQDIARHGASEGIAIIKNLFLEARMWSPCVIYIKDVDAIARKKTDAAPHSDPILLQLITEMQKCDKDGRMVIVIAATTRTPEQLNSNLRNSELFLKEVPVTKPDKDARRLIVDLYLAKYLKEENKEAICSHIVLETEGLRRNDVNKVIKLSKHNALIKGGKFVTMEDVLEALEMVKSTITGSESESMADKKQSVSIECVKDEGQNQSSSNWKKGGKFFTMEDVLEKVESKSIITDSESESMADKKQPVSIECMKYKGQNQSSSN